MTAAVLGSPMMAPPAVLRLPAVSFRRPQLPWANGGDDERRFKRILKRVVGAALVLGLVMPFVPQKQEERRQVQPLPAPMARLQIGRAHV